MSNFQIILNGYHEPERKLSTKETYRLIDKYQATKDPKIKEQLVNDNMKLVLSMTKRFYGRVDNSLASSLIVGSRCNLAKYLSLIFNTL